MARRLIISITATKKPHRVDVMLPFTVNDGDILYIAMSELKNILMKDEAMLITILRDCHDEKEVGKKK